MKEITPSEIEKTLQDFNNLTKAIIDSSSLIYLEKINILNKAKSKIKLFTIVEVIEETKINYTDIIVLNKPEDPEINKTDKLVIQYALKMGIPLISEDKKILKKISRCNIPFFNSLMILCYLFYKNDITEKEYSSLYKELVKIAYYDNFVKKYAENVFNKIKSILTL